MRALMTRSPIAVVIASLCAVTIGAVTAPTVKFTDSKLKNGLRVIISEDHAAPVFSVAVAYNVGSRDERMGRTGFAHLFEHMMFKGSENVGAGEHFFTIFSNGGTMNGTTNKERTLYFETMPANQLDAALFLEADRMRSLAIVKDNLDNQRNAVQEERRLRVDNQPYGRADEAIDELAFDNFAYKHSVIGSLDDLNAASVDDVASFFKTYYAPNNAVIAIVGDVNTASTLERARKYFESIPSQAPPPPVDISQPPQDKERRLDIEDPLARLPRIDIGYRVPSSLSPDDDAIAVLGEILASGRSSRLYEHVVRDKAARRVGAGVRADQPRSPAVRPRSHAGGRRVARPARAGDLLGDRRRQGRVRSPIRRWRRRATRRSVSSSEASTRRWRSRGTWRSTRCCSTTPAGSISDGIGSRSSARATCSASRSSF